MFSMAEEQRECGCKLFVCPSPTVAHKGQFIKVMCVCMLSCFSCVWLCASLWTVARQAPLSMGSSRQEYWSELHALLQGIFPTQGLSLHLGIINFLRDTRHLGASPMAQWVKNPPAMQETQETWVRSLGWEDPLEKWTAAHSSILTWRIPWTVQSMGSQRAGHG